MIRSCRTRTPGSEADAPEGDLAAGADARRPGDPGLTKHYGPNTVLAGLDLEVPAGSILALLGPNGAGKTTAVRILTTLAIPDAGRAAVAGHDVVTEALAVRRSIGVTAQDATVDEMLTGRQNLCPPSSGPQFRPARILPAPSGAAIRGQWIPDLHKRSWSQLLTDKTIIPIV